MAEDIMRGIRAAVLSLPDDVKIAIIYKGESASVAGSGIDIAQQISLYGEDDEYTGSLIISQAQLTQVPQAGDVIEVENKQSIDGLGQMVTRRVLSVNPDPTRAIYRVDYGAQFAGVT